MADQSALAQDTVTVRSLCDDSVTANEQGTVPPFPSTTAQSPIEITGGGSSFRIVPTPCPSPMVPFTGTGPAMNALIAGQVDYVCDPILGPLPHVRAGTVKALAIATGKRSALLPDVPTAAEGGLPQFDAAPFYAMFAPKGTPQPIVDRLADILNRGLNEDMARERLLELGAEVPEPNRRGPEALRALVKSEIARLTPIIAAASAK